jgi:hypothetical protein
MLPKNKTIVAITGGHQSLSVAFSSNNVEAFTVEQKPPTTIRQMPINFRPRDPLFLLMLQIVTLPAAKPELPAQRQVLGGA